MQQNVPMPFLLLALGLLIGAYTLYRFFTTASVEQIKNFFATSGIITLTLALLLLALTRRFPLALVILIITFPLIWKFVKNHYLTDKKQENPSSGPMTQAEAFKILGLEESASESEITDAYKRLMQKVHPDNQGTDWMAAKLNQARDFLLK